MTRDDITALLTLLDGGGLIRAAPTSAGRQTQVTAWEIGLRGLNAADVRLAAETMLQTATSSRQFQVRPADVRAEVKRVRNERLAAVPDPLPDVDPDHTVAYQDRRRQMLDAIADGRPVPKMITPTTTARSDS